MQEVNNRNWKWGIWKHLHYPCNFSVNLKLFKKYT